MGARLDNGDAEVVVAGFVLVLSRRFFRESDQSVHQAWCILVLLLDSLDQGHGRAMPMAYAGCLRTDRIPLVPVLTIKYNCDLCTY